jgi:transcriptional regulator with XRE-family HTH domain
MQTSKINSVKIRRFLNDKGFTIPFLAKKMGITNQSLNYKIGNKIRFNLDDIENLCTITGIEYNELFKNNLKNNK